MRFGALSYEGLTYPYSVHGGERRLLTQFAGQDAGALIGMDADTVSAAVAAAEPFFGSGTALPPIRPGKIVAIGLNYMDHVRETGMEPPKVPLVFAKFPSSIAADGQTVEIDSNLTERVDWEVELVLVVGARCRRVPPERALGYVFGYTVGNDLSARDLQFSDGQWVRAKSLDGFCPLGPEIVTADEIEDPQSLWLRTTVNGEVVQDSTTAEMIFGVAELISFCSHSFTLDPGDVIMTGTPWGCGEFMEPRRSLQDGDVVAVSVESMGTLTNPIHIGPADA